MLSFNMQASSVFIRFKGGFTWANNEHQSLLGTGEKSAKIENALFQFQLKKTKKVLQPTQGTGSIIPPENKYEAN